MGRLVLTRYNKLTGKVEQLTLNNVSLTAEYVDEFGCRTRLLVLYQNDERIMQESYILTQVTDQRLVEGFDYNETDVFRQWKAKKQGRDNNENEKI